MKPPKVVFGAGGKGATGGQVVFHPLFLPTLPNVRYCLQCCKENVCVDAVQHRGTGLLEQEGGGVPRPVSREAAVSLPSPPHPDHSLWVEL